MLTSLLRRRGHEVLTACDGAQAWKTVQDTSVSMMFTDWVMPELNGLDLIRRVRSGQLGRYVYIILCTSRNSRLDLLEGLRSGADDFLAKPVHYDELCVRMSAGERVIALERRLEQDNHRLAEAPGALSRAYETMRSDLEAAARMQQSLLPPPARLHGVRFESLFCPACTLAGDIFNYFPLNETAAGFYLLDVSGHGIPAAMLSVTLSKVLTTSPHLKQTRNGGGTEIAPPEQVMVELNRRFQNNGDMYFTMLYGVLDTKRRVTISQAGHPHPLFLRKGSPVRALGKGGFPVGVFPDIDYDQFEQDLQPGDRLFLTSDGVSECANREGEQFGMARLTAFVDHHQAQDLADVLDGLRQTLCDWSGSDEFKDDVSVVALEMEERYED
jgi:sigma-B regulation protein RsbU (phosphoserine phosphatase)